MRRSLESLHMHGIWRSPGLGIAEQSDMFAARESVRHGSATSAIRARTPLNVGHPSESSETLNLRQPTGVPPCDMAKGDMENDR